MELVEATAEAGTGDGATPGLANKGGTEEAGWLIGGKPEEDLFEELIREHQQLYCHGGL